jgi:hypothetical protein
MRVDDNERRRQGKRKRALSTSHANLITENAMLT